MANPIRLTIYDCLIQQFNTTEQGKLMKVKKMIEPVTLNTHAAGAVFSDTQ